MDDKVMYIISWKVKTMLVRTIQIWIKIPKILNKRIRKHVFKTLGTSIICSQMSPSLGKLEKCYCFFQECKIFMTD